MLRNSLVQNKSFWLTSCFTAAAVAEDINVPTRGYCPCSKGNEEDPCVHSSPAPAQEPACSLTWSSEGAGTAAQAVTCSSSSTSICPDLPALPGGSSEEWSETCDWWPTKWQNSVRKVLKSQTLNLFRLFDSATEVGHLHCLFICYPWTPVTSKDSCSITSHQESQVMREPINLRQ